MNPLMPKTLGAFHEAKVIGLYRCPTCRSDHYGISPEDAAASVAATNAVLASLDEAEAMEAFGARTVSTLRFTRCFFCGSPASSMVALGPNEPFTEPSPLPVIVEMPQSQRSGP